MQARRAVPLHLRVAQADGRVVRRLRRQRQDARLHGARARLDVQQERRRLILGFDHPNLDAQVIATDVKAMIEQYHGRIFWRKTSPSRALRDAPQVLPAVGRGHRRYASTAEDEAEDDEGDEGGAPA